MVLRASGSARSILPVCGFCGDILIFWGMILAFPFMIPMIRRLCSSRYLKAMQLDSKLFKERAVLSQISNAKNELITPEEFLLNNSGDYHDRKVGEVYQEYQKRLKQNNALDFDDLIMKTVELFQNDPQVLEYYQERFRYIMVDEYQDTNTAQFRLIDLLAGKI